MGGFGGFYFGEKRKLSKKQLEKKAKHLALKQPTEFRLPEIIKKK